MEAAGRIVNGGASRVWNLPRHERVSSDCRSDGAAISAVEQSQRAEHSVESVDPRQWIRWLANGDGNNVCRRSKLPGWECAELECVHPKQFAVGHGSDTDLSGHQRYARAAADSAQHVSVRRCESVSNLSDGFRLPLSQRQHASALG